MVETTFDQFAQRLGNEAENYLRAVLFCSCPVVQALGALPPAQDGMCSACLKTRRDEH